MPRPETRSARTIDGVVIAYFEDRGEPVLEGVPDRWQLYSVTG